MLTLQQVRRRVETLAAAIAATADDLPTFGASRDFGRPHVEVDGRGYHVVVVERGRELERRTFDEADELLFAIFRTVTHEMASRWELAHRHPTDDSRRGLFRRQLELLDRLEPAWARRHRRHLESILHAHPYRDGRTKGGSHGPGEGASS